MSPAESRRALGVVTDDAVRSATILFSRTAGSATARRAVLLEAVPELVRVYSDATSTLAADFYDTARDSAAAPGRFSADPIVNDRTVKIRRGVAWASEPMFRSLDVTVEQRLAEIVQKETALPYRDTITTNRGRDAAAVGWRRISGGGCGFCRMLADRGAVYKEATARFAAHPSCRCTAQPVFTTEGEVVEASVMQYTASKRSRSAKDRENLRNYLATYYPD